MVQKTDPDKLGRKYGTLYLTIKYIVNEDKESLMTLMCTYICIYYHLIRHLIGKFLVIQIFEYSYIMYMYLYLSYF